MARFGLVVAALAGLVAVPPARAEDGLATAIKATYLYKFAPFVSWPEAAFAGPDAPLVVCVVGRDPFGATLDRAVAGQRVGPRPIAVRRLPVARGHDGCHIMFLSGSDAQSLGQALQAVRGEPVFTVTDEAGPRAVADFTLVNDRVRFRINDQAAAEAGLTVSSKLLSLAVAVIPRASR